jgi:hypothetical protein
MVTSRITDPGDVAALVNLMNGNRWWANPPLDFATAMHNPKPDVSPTITYWSQGVLVREVHLKGRVLTTRIGPRTVQRQISAEEAELVSRLTTGTGS